MKFRLPANVDMPDRIFAGLTLRQLSILGVDGLLIWLLFVGIGRAVHPAVFGAIALPMAGAGALLVVRTPEGIGLDRLILLAARFLLRPRRLVIAPEGIPFRLRRKARIAPIEIPIQDPSTDGDLIDLGPEGFASVCRASGINLSLRSEPEQSSLIETFARFLNALDGPTQFLVVSRRVDLEGLLAGLKKRASSLGHPALEEAARRHADYLEGLVSRRDVRRRELLLCFRDPVTSEEQASTRLHRRIDQAESLFRGMGITLRRLTSDEAGRYLRACGDPEGFQPPLGADLSTKPITGLVP